VLDTSQAGFGAADWLVLAAYFALLVVSGVLLSRRQASTYDYFLAGGRIPVIAAAISFLATSLSAATFIGGPQQAFAGNLSYLSANIGSILAVVVVALFFVPAFYRQRVATVYSLLGRRFGAPSARASSGAFLVGRLFASGARLYIAALPASLIAFGDIAWQHQLTAIATMTLVGIVYTLAGGIRAVIWTDVIQTVIFVGAAVVAVILLLQKIPIGLSGILDTLRTAGEGQESKLTIFKLGLGGVGPAHTYTILTAIFGFSLLNLGAYGTDQDLAQRLLTCRSAVKGSWSAVTAILVGIPVTALFMGIGLLLYLLYARPDIMGAAAPAYAVEGSRDIFLNFIIHEMPAGVSGLMMAGLFAAGLSSLNSAINAMSSTFINDHYRRLKPDRDERHYLFTGRMGVVAFGIMLGLFACFSVFWQEARPQTTLIDFALLVMVFAYSGLVAVFTTALFTRRGSNTTVIAALITGFAAVVVMQSALAGQIAFPWQMLIATSIAFGVCCIGKSDKGTERLSA